MSLVSLGGFCAWSALNAHTCLNLTHREKFRATVETLPLHLIFATITLVFFSWQLSLSLLVFQAVATLGITHALAIYSPPTQHISRKDIFHLAGGIETQRAPHHIAIFGQFYRAPAWLVPSFNHYFPENEREAAGNLEAELQRQIRAAREIYNRITLFTGADVRAEEENLVLWMRQIGANREELAAIKPNQLFLVWRAALHKPLPVVELQALLKGEELKNPTNLKIWILEYNHSAVVTQKNLLELLAQLAVHYGITPPCSNTQIKKLFELGLNLNKGHNFPVQGIQSVDSDGTIHYSSPEAEHAYRSAAPSPIFYALQPLAQFKDLLERFIQQEGKKPNLSWEHILCVDGKWLVINPYFEFTEGSFADWLLEDFDSKKPYRLKAIRSAIQKGLKVKSEAFKQLCLSKIDIQYVYNTKNNGSGMAQKYRDVAARWSPYLQIIVNKLKTECSDFNVDQILVFIVYALKQEGVGSIIHLLGGFEKWDTDLFTKILVKHLPEYRSRPPEERR